MEANNNKNIIYNQLMNGSVTIGEIKQKYGKIKLYVRRELDGKILLMIVNNGLGLTNKANKK
jgi:hypothetical protein